MSPPVSYWTSVRVGEKDNSLVPDKSSVCSLQLEACVCVPTQDTVIPAFTPMSLCPFAEPACPALGPAVPG